MVSNDNTEILFSISDLQKMPIIESNEQMVSLPDIIGKDIICKPAEYLKQDETFLSTCFMVRKGVAERLNQVVFDLKKWNSEAQLLVNNCYRSLKVQKANYELTISKVKSDNPNLSLLEIQEKAHEWIAAPDVAGHPTGAAIDLTIVTPDGGLDMGMAIGDFSQAEKLPAVSKFVSAKVLDNRLFLRKLMMKYDFAPFNGEWWHFSYGDREWASFYSKDNAIYSAVELD